MRRLIIGIGIVAVIAGALAWFTLGRGDPAAAPSYRFAALDRGDVIRSVSATGRLEALVTVEVGSQLSGQVQDILVDFNDTVTAGQVIARIDPATFAQRVLQAEADIQVQRASARASAAQAVQSAAERDDSARELERLRPLFEREIISQAQWDAAQTRLARSDAALAAAEAQADVSRARVVQAEAALANAKVDLDRAVIRSPVDGVVVGRNIEPGQTVAASFQAPVLFTIAQDLARMRIEIQVDEADIGEIEPGLPIRFTVDAFPDREFDGRVDQVRKLAQVQQSVVTYTVTAETSNPGGALLPGMTANVDIVIEERRDVLRAPNAALRFSPAEGAARTPGSEGGAQRGGGQSRGGGGQGGGQMLANLTERLSLTPDQAREVGAIFEANRAGMGALFQQVQSGAITQEQLQERLRAQMRDAFAKIEPLLTDDQKIILAEIRAEQQSGRARNGVLWTVDAEGRLVRHAVRLGASDASVTEIESETLKAGDQVVTGGGASSAAAAPGGGRSVRVF